VPYFTGDNGGSTWQGITKDEIRVVVYSDQGSRTLVVPHEPTYAPGIYDLDQIPSQPCGTAPGVVADPTVCSDKLTRVTRALGAYFNGVDGYQTYNRRVHYYIQIATPAATSQTRKRDAQQLVASLAPFAAFDESFVGGNNAAYDSELATRDVMVFASPQIQSTSSLAADSPMRWSFWPDEKSRADVFVGYVCRKLAFRPVAHSGTMNGRPRRFGFYYTSDRSMPEVAEFVSFVKDGLATCGVSPALEVSFPFGMYSPNDFDPGVTQTLGARAMQTAGVTTVLWLGGMDTKFSHYAATNGYLPEIVLAGDNVIDAAPAARLQDPLVWKNAWGTELQLPFGCYTCNIGSQAAKQADPSADDTVIRGAGLVYRDHFMLFEAIQLAGPRLTPAKASQGFRAIPSFRSSSWDRPACYFGASEESCMKDAAEAWWDPTGIVGGGTEPGCMSLVSQGARSRAGDWTGADQAFVTTHASCTAFEPVLPTRT
jgi:hypothetical protein